VIKMKKTVLLACTGLLVMGGTVLSTASVARERGEQPRHEDRRDHDRKDHDRKDQDRKDHDRGDDRGRGGSGHDDGPGHH
jgi:hypothetical protein